jgi:hypothetical protein
MAFEHGYARGSDGQGRDDDGPARHALHAWQDLRAATVALGRRHTDRWYAR